MPDNLSQELALLPRLGVADLRSRYVQLFGEITRTESGSGSLGSSA